MSVASRRRTPAWWWSLNPLRAAPLGALMPFGEHKGYGLAIACELLGGALTGGGTWHRKPDTARAIVNGMLTILIDPQKLGTQASSEQEALAFIGWLQQSPPAPGFDRVRLAGRTGARGPRAARAGRHCDRRDDVGRDRQRSEESGCRSAGGRLKVVKASDDKLPIPLLFERGTCRLPGGRTGPGSRDGAERIGILAQGHRRAEPDGIDRIPGGTVRYST